MSNIKNIKDQIKTQLDALVTAGTLGAAETMDIRKDPLDGEIPKFPAAFVMPPSMTSRVEDNRTLMRTYTFAIMVVENAENLSSTTQIEELMEAIVNRFDNLPTLAGTADGAVEPATSAPEPLQRNSKDYVVFFVSLAVNKTETLTY